jgi:hypothetical protein
MRPLHSRRSRTKLADAHAFRKVGHLTGMGKDDYLSDADRIRVIEDVEKQLRETTKRNFPRTNNLEYAILKTHLIIENTLTHYIRCTSFLLAEPEDIRFSFVQKLDIAILHGFGNGCPTSVPSVELLNRLRNQVAHRFTFDRNLVNELIQINSEDLDVKKLTDRQRIRCLKQWCYFLCGGMAGELKAYIQLTSRAQPVAPPTRRGR